MPKADNNKRKRAPNKDNRSLILASTGPSTNANKRRSDKLIPCSTSSIISTDSSSIQTDNWLPPISSLDLPTLGSNVCSPPYIKKEYIAERLCYHEPLYTYIPESEQAHPKPKPKPKPKPTIMPMIPYYFHHAEFGIEACMLQLEEQRRMQERYYYAKRTGKYL